MAFTNIELYEALKRDLSEDAARMIAEVVPPAGDLATKGDLAATRADIAATRADIERLELATKMQLLEAEQRLERRMTSMERRYYFVIGVPLWGGVAATLVKFLLA